MDLEQLVTARQIRGIYLTALFIMKDKRCPDNSIHRLIFYSLNLAKLSLCTKQKSTLFS